MAGIWLGVGDSDIAGTEVEVDYAIELVSECEDKETVDSGAEAVDVLTGQHEVVAVVPELVHMLINHT